MVEFSSTSEDPQDIDEIAMVLFQEIELGEGSGMTLEKVKKVTDLRNSLTRALESVLGHENAMAYDEYDWLFSRATELIRSPKTFRPRPDSSRNHEIRNLKKQIAGRNIDWGDTKAQADKYLRGQY